ncbi:hypothetical protein [Spirillospora albida]|uniref:hypothetical protein n=1 Tax=Spirillospora albida TaxID=58123 RepID=UPI0012FCA497|nr:hypothetical protein [Spirillospora albida]
MPMRVLAVLALCALAACSPEARVGGVPVPSGFQEYRTGQYAFAHPAGWRRTEESATLTVLAPPTPDGVRDGHIHVQRYRDYPQDFATVLDRFRGIARLNHYRITLSEPAKLAGAVRAHRFEASYDLRLDEDRRVPYALVGMYALTKEKTLVEFMVRTPRRSAAQASAILSTLRLRENG